MLVSSIGPLSVCPSVCHKIEISIIGQFGLDWQGFKKTKSAWALHLQGDIECNKRAISRQNLEGINLH